MNNLKENRKKTKKIICKLGKAVNNLNFFSEALYKTYMFYLPNYDLDELIQDTAIILRDQLCLKSSYVAQQILLNYSELEEIRFYLLELRILRQEREMLEN